ncbi:MAG TPA: thiaminase II [Alphaproteobacteria bacterium]|nr:thiaminase II [Alphaproteobacteria bacterium]
MSTACHDALKRAAQPIWDAILAHPFLKELGEGSLPHERFLYFIRQDYLYLFDFARVLCLGGSKAEDLDTLEMFAKHAANTVAVERAMHTGFAERLGVDLHALQHTERTPTTQAYTRHLLAVGREGTLGEIVAAVLPCYWIYWEVGRQLSKCQPTDPIYQAWIRAYGAEAFAALVQQQLDLVDRLGARAPAHEYTRMTEHFILSSRYEYLFWDDAYRLVQWPV